MFFTVDNKNKIIFGWSEKCACSHVKNIFWFLQNDKVHNEIHTMKDINSLPSDIENYTTLIFSRNPYKRVISGFLDKYRPRGGEYRHMWKSPIITFSQFVNELSKNNWDAVDRAHFIPQTQHHFNRIILKSKHFKCYDIENINYNYIEQLYNKKIPSEVMNKKEGHERIKRELTLDCNVYDIDMKEYYNYNVDNKYFYSEEIKNKIFEFYKADFLFFYEVGIDYINTPIS